MMLTQLPVSKSEDVNMLSKFILTSLLVPISLGSAVDVDLGLLIDPTAKAPKLLGNPLQNVQAHCS